MNLNITTAKTSDFAISKQIQMLRGQKIFKAGDGEGKL